MKALKLFVLVAILMPCQLMAASIDTAGQGYFLQAKQHLENMLSGKENPSYEEAIYQIENAWFDGNLSKEIFNDVLNFHCDNIRSIILAQQNPAQQNHRSELLKNSLQKNQEYQKAKSNYCIYSYITTTTMWQSDKLLMSHNPYSYSFKDPMGTTDWTNTQVTHLLTEGNGNCFALASLFKIFSERLQSDAKLCTAPGHIYIRHADDNGTFYNVELSSKAFPGTGTIETLTYTPDEATKNNIALRELDLRQSIALCLVYLAKGYEYKFGIKDDNLSLACAESALKYDDHNLNAMLLKAEVLECRLIKQQKAINILKNQTAFREYQQWIDRIYKLGYREMPFEMKNILIKGWTRDTLVQLAAIDHTPQHANLTGRYASLSWGLFDEEIRTKPLERFGNTVFDTKKEKVIAFLNDDILFNQYNFDPVVFAWNIDPLAHKYPGISPYVAFADNPIIYTDHQGNYVEGMNKKPVTYEMMKNGSIQWSSNASADTKRLGNAMLKTTTGAEMFSKAQETTYPIGMHTNRPGDGNFGFTDIKGSFDDEGKFQVARADVWVNPDAMDKFKMKGDANYAGMPDINKKLKSYISNSPDGEEKQGAQDYYLLRTHKKESVVGATASHEVDHATDPTNIQNGQENLRDKGKPGHTDKDIESEPNKVEQKALDQSTK